MSDEKIKEFRKIILSATKEELKLILDSLDYESVSKLYTYISDVYKE